MKINPKWIALSLSTITIFGTGATSHGRAALAGIRDTVYGMLGTEHLVKAAALQLEERKEKLLDAESTMQSQRRQAEDLLAEVRNADLKIKEAKTRLETLRPALESGGSLQLGGCSYSSKEVAEDAKALVAFLDKVEIQRESSLSRVKALRKLTSTQEDLLSKARTDYQAAETRLQTLAGEIEAGEAAAEARKLAESIRDDLDTRQGDLARTFGELERRLNHLNEAGALLESSTVPGGNVRFEDAASPSLIESVNKRLGRETAKPAADPVTAPCTGVN